MKIGNPADKTPALPPVASQPAAAADASKVAASAAAASAVAASSSTTVDPSAHVELSSTASSLLAGGSGADFDAVKVKQISDSISGGTYKIDASKIADKLIANAQELLSKVQS